MPSEVKVTRPAFKWIGGKWKHAHRIIPHFPSHDLYAEPFCGAASVLLHKPRSQAEIINDRDGDVVNFFRTLRDRPLELVAACNLSGYARDELRLSQDAIFSRDPAGGDLRRAADFVIIAQQSFNALVTKRSGWAISSTHTPNNAGQFARWAQTLFAIAERLSGVHIENVDAMTLINRIDATNVLLYVDPPYHPETRNDRLYKTEFSADQHDALLDRLNRCSSAVVFSGYMHASITRAFRRWRHTSWRTHSGAAQHQPKGVQNDARRVEHIWIKPAKGARRC